MISDLMQSGNGTGCGNYMRSSNFEQSYVTETPKEEVNRVVVGESCGKFKVVNGVVDGVVDGAIDGAVNGGNFSQ